MPKDLLTLGDLRILRRALTLPAIAHKQVARIRHKIIVEITRQEAILDAARRRHDPKPDPDTDPDFPDAA